MHMSLSHKEGMGANAPQPFDRPELKQGLRQDSERGLRVKIYLEAKRMLISLFIMNMLCCHKLHTIQSNSNLNYQDSCRFIQGLQ